MLGQEQFLNQAQKHLCESDSWVRRPGSPTSILNLSWKEGGILLLAIPTATDLLDDGRRRQF